MRRYLALGLCVLVTASGIFLASVEGAVRPQQGGEPSLRVGDRLPDVPLVGVGGQSVMLTESSGRVKLISVVPQLNTPVCDEQTHQLSEQNGGLDRQVELITLSTNTADDQARFAKKAKIGNIRFLSDAPAHGFGKQSGLLLPMYGILQRAVIVADGENIVRYVQLVPMGEVPNFAAVFEAVRQVLRSVR